MPYADHPVFESPTPTQVIWRYMNLSRLLSILQSQSLFFTMASVLRAERDPYEGRQTIAYLQYVDFMLKAKYADHSADDWKDIGIKSQGDFETNQKILSMASISEVSSLETTFISCWAMDEEDSDALWRLYTNVYEGVAIRTDFQSLCKSLDACKGSTIEVGKIKYIDTKIEFIRRDYAQAPYMCKRNSFSHEKELRAILLAMEHKDREGIRFHEKGAFVSVDLKTLIKSVWISPLADSSITALVQDILPKYGLGDLEVVKSSLWSYPEHLIPPLPPGTWVYKPPKK